MRRFSPGALPVFLTALIVLFGAGSTSYYNQRGYPLPNTLLFLCSFILFTLIRVLSGMLSRSQCFRKIARNPHTITVVALAVFLLQLLICYAAYFETAWDVRMVLENARIYAAQNEVPSIEYFSRYTNNLFLLKLFSLVFRIFGQAYGTGAILVICCMINSISGLSTFRVIRRIYGVRAAWSGYLLWFLLIGTSPWLLIPYSDAMSLCLPVLLFDLWLCASDATGRSRTVLYGVMSLLAALSYRLKPQAFIIVIAILIVTTARHIRNRTLRRQLLSRITAVSVPVFLAAFILTGIWTKASLPLDRNLRFPVTHYLMMGANVTTNGAYSGDDVAFSASFATVQERQAANLSETGNRYKNMGGGCN